MRAHVVKIGNSQGIRIPKPLLDQTGIVDDVDIEVEKNQIIIRPILNPRAGWDNAFKTMAKNGHDKLLDGEDNISNSWDEEEWQRLFPSYSAYLHFEVTQHVSVLNRCSTVLRTFRDYRRCPIF